MLTDPLERAVRERFNLVEESGEPPRERDQHCEQREHRQRVGVQPRREHVPASGDGVLGVGVHEVDDRGRDERCEPDAHRQSGTQARRLVVRVTERRRGSAGRRRRSPRRARRARRAPRASAHHAPSRRRAGTGSTTCRCVASGVTWNALSTWRVRARPATSAHATRTANVAIPRRRSRRPCIVTRSYSRRLGSGRARRPRFRVGDAGDSCVDPAPGEHSTH